MCEIVAAKKKDKINGRSFIAGTIPYMQFELQFIAIEKHREEKSYGHAGNFYFFL